MTAFVISADQTFPSSAVDTSDTFTFDNKRGSTVTLTFTYSDFDLDPGYTINGSGGVNVVVFNLADHVEPDLVVFNDWSMRDKVILNGTNGDDNLDMGTTQPNLIRGLGGNDHLTGRSQFDTLMGGNGEDEFYILDNGIDINGGDGSDFVVIGFEGLAQMTIDLSDGGGGRDVGGGMTLTGIESFYGTLSGADDSFIGGDRGDTIMGSFGHDTLSGLNGEDILNGGDGNDVLNGGAGRDALLAGAGYDMLTGGTGADRFIFKDWNDVAVSPKADEIEDFEQGRDKIDLSRLDGDLSNSDPHDPMHFIGETLPMIGFGGQVGVEVEGANTRIYLYNDGSLFGQILLMGVFDLSARDFIL